MAIVLISPDNRSVLYQKIIFKNAYNFVFQSIIIMQEEKNPNKQYVTMQYLFKWY